MDEYTKHEILELVWFGVYVVLVIGIFTLLVGFGLGGFEAEEVLKKNMFYIPYGAIFFIGVMLLKVAGILVFKKKHADIEGPISHDSEQSPIGSLRLVKNPLLLIFFCLIFFGLLGFLASRYQTFFSEIPRYEQQFTEAADVFFSVYPASPSETLGAIFLISLVGFVLGYYVMKGKLGKTWFLILFIPIGTLVSTFYGIANHIMRYSGSEIAMQNVVIFWTIGGLITTISGSVIPFLIMHDVNNFFFRFSRLFGSEIVMFITFTVIGLLLLLSLLIYFRKRKKRRSSTT